MLLLQLDRFKGIACLHPGIVTAFYDEYSKSLLLENQRHTGAGCFIRSSTVNGYFPIGRKVAEMAAKIIRRNDDCAGNLS